MKSLSSRLLVKSLNPFNHLTIQRFNLSAVFFPVVFLLTISAAAQFPPSGRNIARSVSGQFIVVGIPESSPLADLPLIATNSDFVRLQPALLAVTAERIKQSLWHKLGIDSTTPWRGQIFLVLHPARSLDENVTIVSKFSANGWSYQVQFPDVLSRARFTRAMTSVILLEFANRHAGPRATEIPAWLADGLSQQLLAIGPQAIILSSPAKMVNGLAVTRIDINETNLDSLADARRVLKNFPALTFEQLSWPTDRQIAGDDDGVYLASAQLFVSDLLALKGGAAKLRAMLENLPHFYNWQLAFQTAYHENFPRVLDVEKWWALQVVDFVARGPNAQWTPIVSREKLDEILSVQVEIRSASNSLPVSTAVSLQAVIRNFDSDRQAAILQTKLRDLELAQFRVAPVLAVLTDGYRRAIADYLGENSDSSRLSPRSKHNSASSRASARETLQKLDALDAQRQTLEATIHPINPVQPHGVSPKDLGLNIKP